eukprot:CAMPEP_0180281562 /NCGR_PEP_ID=MMETSP0988-20121125/9279_1 /TAXON_ID=697907 /ORGANISM="non described non described, Strain CCMP2293" /LENGTH=400 /DNA_ID=CAMNT_0022253577 /DNA_START=26 /DNA_END=1225 /DNA_ORIENTATION=+
MSEVPLYLAHHPHPEARLSRGGPLRPEAHLSRGGPVRPEAGPSVPRRAHPSRGGPLSSIPRRAPPSLQRRARRSGGRVVGHVSQALCRLPVHPIAKAAANWKEPDPGVGPEHLDEVAFAAEVERVDLVFLGGVALLHVLDGRHVLEQEHVVEPREAREDDGDSHHEAEDHQKLELHDRELQGVSLDDRRNEPCEDGGGDVEARDGRVGTEEDEVLVVAIPDAVVHPRAVVVHLQHAAPAVLAVVRAVWLELAALAAVPLPPIQLTLGRRDGQGGVLLALRHALRHFSLEPEAVRQVELRDPRLVELVRHAARVCEDDLPVAAISSKNTTWKDTSSTTQLAVLVCHRGSAVRNTKQWYTSGMTISTTMEMKNRPHARIWSLHLSAIAPAAQLLQPLARHFG